MAGNTLRVSIVAADHAVWSGEATQVSAKTVIGEIGILANHEPVLAILAEGTIRVTLPNGEKLVAEAGDGFLSMENNTVTVVARRAALV